MTRYVFNELPTPGRTLLKDGDLFTLTPHMPNGLNAVLEVGFCSGAHPIVFPDGTPVPPDYFDGLTPYDFTWRSGPDRPGGGGGGVWETPFPVPPLPPSELVWPDGNTLSLPVGFDINGEIGDNPSNIRFSAFPDGSTSTRQSSGQNPSGLTLTQGDWRNPATEPVSNYEVRWRVISGGSSIVNNWGAFDAEVWHPIVDNFGEGSNYQPVFDNNDAPGTVVIAWDFRDAGNDATIRTVTITVDFSEGFDPTP